MGCDSCFNGNIIRKIYISIHAPRVGCDAMDALLLIATELAISIHAPRVGCDGMTVNYNGKLSRISIHAPRVGCDHILLCLRFQPFVISIHAPRVGCDFAFWKSLHRNDGFQSTHPGWGATYVSPVSLCSIIFQSTHPGWGATVRKAAKCLTRSISIHAPRVGCDAGIASRR